jgi:hypothetical protein
VSTSVDNATAGFGEFTDALQVKVTAGHAQLRIQLFQDRAESELLGQVGSPGPGRRNLGRWRMWRMHLVNN